MTRIIENHGAWCRYTPEPFPGWAPHNALFARRESDGVDWYDYLNWTFYGDTVKLTVIDGIVGAATTDPTKLFPAGATVLEIDGFTGLDPQEEFGRKIYDAATQTFKDPPPPPQDPMLDLIRRVKALELELR